MRKIVNAVLAACLVMIPVQGSFAQLISVDKNYTIKNVDMVHNRLAVKYLNAADEPVREQLLVDVNGATQVFMNGHPIAWTQLRPGMEIEVKGGLETQMHIKAKTIIVKKMLASH